MGGYLRFSATGDPAIDAILNALNDAGTAYHNTGQWDEGPEEEGPSYCDLIQEAANAAALARSQPSEWVATKARQPDEHEAVLAFHPDWGVDVCMRENGWPLQIGANMEYATHWMELPKPPALLPPNVEAKS